MPRKFLRRYLGDVRKHGLILDGADDQLPVQGRDVLYQPLLRERSAHELAAAVAHLGAKIRAVDEEGESASETLRVATGRAHAVPPNREPVGFRSPFPEDVDDPADGGRRDRAPGGHGFDQRDRSSLVFRGQTDDVEVRVEPQNVAPKAEEDDARRDTELARQAFEVGAARRRRSRRAWRRDRAVRMRAAACRGS